MIKVSYATMEAMGMLVKRLGQDARRLEKALAETMNASAEWKRIAEEMKKERNALRAATIDTAAGSLLDAFGSLANEPRNGSPDDKYHVRIVTKIHAIKLDRDALRKERDDLRTQLATERERYKQTPCDPPASHDTPAGKEAAHAAAEPKPGDVVRLVRVPTCNDYGHAWILEWGAVGNMGKVCKIRSYPFGNVAVVDIDARLSYEWPLSCVEIVRTEPDEIKVGDVVRATFWKAGQAALVKEILADGRLRLDCSDQPWRVDEVVKLVRKVTT